MSRLNQLVTLIRTLPPNPLGPNGPAQLSIALENILSRSFPSAGITPSLPPSSSSSTPPIPPTTPTPTSILTQTTIPIQPLGPREEKAVEGMLRAIESLKANEALMQYPPSVRTLRPSHDPLMYKRVVDGVHRSQLGQKRSWWRKFFQLKGEA